MGRFESNDSHPSLEQRPLRVPQLAEGIWETAKDLVSDLPKWKLLGEDASKGELVCERSARFLSSKSTVTIKIAGIEGMPSTTIALVSQSSGGLLSGDKKNVVEWMTLFRRSVV